MTLNVVCCCDCLPTKTCASGRTTQSTAFKAHRRTPQLLLPKKNGLMLCPECPQVGGHSSWLHGNANLWFSTMSDYTNYGLYIMFGHRRKVVVRRCLSLLLCEAGYNVSKRAASPKFIASRSGMVPLHILYGMPD